MHISKLHGWKRSFLGVLFCLGTALAIAYAVEEYTGSASPTQYTTLTLGQAREDVEDLRQTLRGSHLSAAERMSRVRQIVARNKRGINRQNDRRSSEHVIDVTGMNVPGLQ